MRSRPRALENVSTSSVQLRSNDGSTYLEVMSGQITATDNFKVTNGATGSFTDTGGQIITVRNGIIVSIA